MIHRRYTSLKAGLRAYAAACPISQRGKYLLQFHCGFLT